MGLEINPQRKNESLQRNPAVDRQVNGEKLPKA
jgi:hypothetical protein